MERLCECGVIERWLRGVDFEIGGMINDASVAVFNFSPRLPERLQLRHLTQKYSSSHLRNYAIYHYRNLQVEKSKNLLNRLLCTFYSSHKKRPHSIH